MPKDLFEEHGIDLLSGPEEQQEEPGLLKRIGQGYMNYAGGALRGMGQAAGDIGASAINWPISGIEYLSGKNLPHVPHPNLINENPNSLSESVGQTLGQLTGGLALPGGAGLKAAQLAGKGYGALTAGRKLPMLAKLLAGGAGGALEGAAGSEENRGLGAALGSVAGTAGYALPAAYDFAKSIGSKNIVNHVKDEVSRLKNHFSEIFGSHLQAGEEAGANKFLKAERGNVPLIKKAGETGSKKGEKNLTYALEKYNENPTLTNAHNAQRDLGKIQRIHAGSTPGTLEYDAYKEALKLKNRLLTKISESFEKAGVKEHGEGYKRARVEYPKELSPYLESPAVNALLGKNKAGIQTVRPTEFADKLLKEEEFLSEVGKKHPGLLRREKYKRLKKNKIAQGAALGIGGALTAGLLPYAVSKALGLK